RVTVVKYAFSVDGWELDLPDQVDRGDNRLLLCIDHGRVVTIAVERKDVLADGFIDDGVCIKLARRHLAGHLQRLQIEKHNLLDSRPGPRVAICDETFAEIFGDGDAVTARDPADLTYYRIVVGVENDDLGAMRHVYAPCVRVDCEVVVILVT